MNRLSLEDSRKDLDARLREWESDGASPARVIPLPKGVLLRWWRMSPGSAARRSTESEAKDGATATSAGGGVEQAIVAEALTNQTDVLPAALAAIPGKLGEPRSSSSTASASTRLGCRTHRRHEARTVLAVGGTCALDDTPGNPRCPASPERVIVSARLPSERDQRCLQSAEALAIRRVRDDAFGWSWQMEAAQGRILGKDGLG